MLGTSRILVACGAVTVLLLTVFGVSSASGQSCTPADSLNVWWVQGILTEEVNASNRAMMGLAHLANQPIAVLGSEAGDEAICADLFEQLGAAMRSAVNQSATHEVTYYRVGDRYLLQWGPATSGSLGPEVLISFDSQFNQIAAGSW